MPITRISVGSQRFDQLRRKHEAFWRRSPAGYLAAVNVFAPSAPVRLPQPDGRVVTHADRLTPEMIYPEEIIAETWAWDPEGPNALLRAKEGVLAYPGVGDLMPFSRAFFKIPWLEAMLGCPITMTEGQIWVEPYPGDPMALVEQGVAPDNPWLELYVEFLQKLQTALTPLYAPSTNTLFRGPSDLVAALLGVKETCMGWLDQPARMAKLMRLCTDVHLMAVEAGYAVMEPFQGGYMNGYGVWAPGPVTRMQADHSTLCSPDLYATHILPYDLEIIQACPYCLFHIHNNGYHIAPQLIEIDELDAIEVVVDPYPTGARKAHEVEMMQLIQTRKPLMVDANFPSYAEAEWMLNQLDRAGLYFNMQFDPATLATLSSDMPKREVWLLAD